MAEVITLETNKCFHALKWIGVVYRILEVHGSDDCSDGEDDYEELDKGSGMKKRWLKPSRGAVKKASKNPKKPAKVRKQPVKKAPAVKRQRKARKMPAALPGPKMGPGRENMVFLAMDSKRDGDAVDRDETTPLLVRIDVKTYKLLPTTVMGERLMLTGTLRPVRESDDGRGPHGPDMPVTQTSVVFDLALDLAVGLLNFNFEMKGQYEGNDDPKMYYVVQQNTKIMRKPLRQLMREERLGRHRLMRRRMSTSTIMQLRLYRELFF
ncbi:hypothetical protein DFH07DRAFT_772882 [Mycena maculata]|uniref:Uncharacterized protein n=1 Tax=Mycena maculata TaxID=230809 RepID=A0AAD7J7M0_9AGAR|nr:hypothetical protein DFH07DRAFT_772882 [Mycena maculata]